MPSDVDSIRPGPAFRRCLSLLALLASAALGGAAKAQVCGTPNPNDCCATNTTPGCSDATCCELVCSEDPFCCETAWDNLCANRASVICASCEEPPPPANDECLGAIPLGEGVAPFSTIGATGVDSTTCAENGTDIHNTVWYFYDATEPGTVTLSLCAASGGSANYDSKVAIFTGACDGLTFVACDDDTCDLSSEVSWVAECGVRYYVCVGGFDGFDAGEGVLALISDNAPCVGCGAPSAGDCCVPDLTPFCSDASCCNLICAADPFCCTTRWDEACAFAANANCASCDSDTVANDECAGAESLKEGTTRFSTAGATGVEATGCTEFGGNVYNNIWFYYDAEEAGTVTLSLCAASGGSANYDSKVAIFTGTCDELQYLTCDDDTCDLSSEVSWVAECGVRYYVCLGAYGPAGVGSGTIAFISDNAPCVGCGAPSAGDCCVANPTPYCSDATCCDLVCSADPFCCATAWDQVCANIAFAQCGICEGKAAPNDECTGAAGLAEGVTAFSLAGATGVDATDCTDNGGNIFTTVWYYYDAVETGTVTLSLCPADGGAANYDSKVAIFAGTCDGLEFLTCDDDTCGTFSRVSWSAECGVRYYVCLGGYDLATQGAGSFALISENDACAGGVTGDLNGDGVVDALDLAALLAAWDSPAGDLDGDGNTGALDLAALLANWTF